MNKPKIRDKIYDAAGVKSKLIDIEDLSLDEEDEINVLVNSFTTDDNTITGRMGNDQVKKLIPTILIPINSKEKIEPGKMKGKVVNEVVKDFFLIVMLRGISIRANLGNLPRELIKQAADSVDLEKK